MYEQGNVIRIKMAVENHLVSLLGNDSRIIILCPSLELIYLINLFANAQKFVFRITAEQQSLQNQFLKSADSIRVSLKRVNETE